MKRDEGRIIAHENATIVNIKERLYDVENRYKILEQQLGKLQPAFIEDCPFCGHETPFMTSYNNGAGWYNPPLLHCLVCGKEFQKKERLEEVK